METLTRTVFLNGEYKNVECIVPFFENNYFMQPKADICQINVTPEKYSPIFYTASLGEALVDFYTLRTLRYEETIDISSVTKYIGSEKPETVTLSKLTLKLLSKVDTANCTVLANLIDFYSDRTPCMFKDEFSRSEAERIVRRELHDKLLVGGYPVELLPYAETLNTINEYDDNDFYYIAACLYARCEVRYPFLDKICSLIEQDYSTIEIVDLDALQLRLDAMMKESGFTTNDFSEIKITEES